MQLINGALLLNSTLLFPFASSGAVKAIVPFTAIYAKITKLSIRIGVLIPISLLKL